MGISRGLLMICVSGAMIGCKSLDLVPDLGLNGDRSAHRVEGEPHIEDQSENTGSHKNKRDQNPPPVVSVKPVPVIIGDKGSDPTKSPVQVPVVGQPHVIGHIPPPSPVQLPPANHPPVIPPDPIAFKTVSADGNGCPAGTVTSTLSPDRLAMTVIYSAFKVEASPQVNRLDDTKSCELKTELSAPSGYRVALWQVTHRGFADLDQGTGGSIVSNYRFASGGQAQFSRGIVGPFEQPFKIEDKLPAVAWGWSRCGGKMDLTIKTTLQVKSQGQLGALLTVDSTDQKLQQIYALAWEKC